MGGREKDCLGSYCVSAAGEYLHDVTIPRIAKEMAIFQYKTIMFQWHPPLSLRFQWKCPETVGIYTAIRIPRPGSSPSLRPEHTTIAACVRLTHGVEAIHSVPEPWQDWSDLTGRDPGC